MSSEEATVRDTQFRDLVLSFPCLQIHANSSLVQLDAWAAQSFTSSAEKASARFVLNLWNNRHPWKVGEFDLFDALACWDAAHRRAFQAWAANPWRP